MSVILRFAAFEFDPARRELRKHRLKIRVPDQSLQILAALLAQPGETISRDRIQTLLWPNGTVVGFERSINAAVTRLREALGDRADKARFIERVPRQGYRFIAPVSRVERPESAPAGRQSGAAVLHYTLMDKIGAGSMGEVWKAEDTRLRRIVALKFLPERVAADEVAMANFRQEAQHAAAVNHPHVCTIYALEESGSDRFLVMEYIDGHSLSEELGGLPLPPHRIAEVGVQAAEALAAAHGCGLIHRDVKPANLMIAADGAVKLTDFGISRPTGETHAAGTLGYMSPEQYRRAVVTATSDIFSLGVVLREMAGGSLHRLPRGLRRVIQTALTDDPQARWQTASQMARALRQAGSYPRSTWAWAAPAFVALCLAAAFAISRKPAPPLMKVSSIAGLPGHQWGPALSHDGRHLAFVWNGEKRDNYDIYVQTVGDATPRRLTTDAAFEFSPVWSPDDRQLAFVRETPIGADILIISAAGGAERKIYSSAAICTFGIKPAATQFCGISWSPDGSYLTLPDRESPGAPQSIFLVDVTSGQKRKITSPQPSTFGDGLSAISPDSRSLAFIRTPATYFSDIYVLPLSASHSPAGEPRRLTEDGDFIFGFDWTADSRGIIFASSRGGASALWHVPLASGPIERLPVGGGRAAWPSVAKRANRLAYAETDIDINLWRTSLDGGAPTRLTQSPQIDFQPAISPDGKSIAFASNRSGNFEIWTCGADGSSANRLTFFNAGLGHPAWSPDGKQIAFWGTQQLTQKTHIYIVAAAGGTPRRITADDFGEVRPWWSHDAKSIYFGSNRGTGGQIWKASVDGGLPVQVTRKAGFHAVESNDGKFVYFSRSGRIWRIASEGGEEQPVLSLETGTLWDLTVSGIYLLKGSRLNFFHFDRSELKLSLDLPGVPTNWPNGTFSVSPDSRWLVYERKDREEASVFIADNFR